jgi:hypothetical protein
MKPATSCRSNLLLFLPLLALHPFYLPLYLTSRYLHSLPLAHPSLPSVIVVIAVAVAPPPVILSILLPPN